MTTNTKTVAFVNLKGGVGKTTSAIGTAEALARLGHTVTVRDADPSGAATLWAHKALSAGRPLPFGVEVVNRFTVAAPAEEEWVLIDTPPLQTDLVEAAVDAADLVLCRAGASTLAELTCIGKPAILIPSPNVTNNHQERNARVLEHAGGAKVLLEGAFTADDLYNLVSDLLSDPAQLAQMAENMRAAGTADAAERIADLVLKLADRHGK